MRAPRGMSARHGSERGRPPGGEISAKTALIERIIERQIRSRRVHTGGFMEKVFLVDAYALIFRFYYAFIGRPMRNAAGVNTSAVFGFVKFLKDLILRERPHYLGVAFDPPGGNFRHELYADYKANRSETPEDIVASVPYIKH